MSTERLVEELARDVAPVSRVPRLRTALLAVFGIWALAFGAMRLLGSGAAAPAGAVSHGDPRYLTIAVGVGILAVGAVLRALAGAIPGREPIARVGTGVAAIGAAALALGCIWALVGGEARGEFDLGGSLLCMVHAVMLALLPMIGVSLFLARAYARRPQLAAIFATTGVVLSAAYGLWLYRRVIFGALEKENLKSLLDLSTREKLILYPMAALVIFFGIYPAPIMDVTAASVDALLNNYNLHIEAASVAAAN